MIPISLMVYSQCLLLPSFLLTFIYFRRWSPTFGLIMSMCCRSLHSLGKHYTDLTNDKVVFKLIFFSPSPYSCHKANRKIHCCAGVSGFWKLNSVILYSSGFRSCFYSLMYWHATSFCNMNIIEKLNLALDLFCFTEVSVCVRDLSLIFDFFDFDFDFFKYGP